MCGVRVGTAELFGGGLGRRGFFFNGFFGCSGFVGCFTGGFAGGGLGRRRFRCAGTADCQLGADFVQPFFFDAADFGQIVHRFKGAVGFAVGNDFFGGFRTAAAKEKLKAAKRINNSFFIIRLL